MLAIAAILFVRFISRKDLYAFFLIIFTCSLFRFGVSNGGLFNIISFILVGFVLIANYFSKFELKRRYNSFQILLIIAFVIFNILGWITKNPLGTSDIIYAVASLFGMVFIFLMLSRLRLTDTRINLFVNLLVILLIYTLLVNINQSLNLIKIRTPLLFGAEMDSRHSFGTYGDSEIYGEYALLNFAFLLPLYLSSISSRRLGLNRRTLLIGVVLSLIHVLLSASRSVAILIVLIVIIVVIISNLSNNRIFDRNQNIIPYIFFVTILFISMSIIFDTNYIFERLARLDVEGMTVENILQGETINREYAFSFAYERIESESWHIGYGWGTRESNSLAWFEKESIRKIRADYHSLYLSLPMIFGWGGSVALLLLFLTITIKLIAIFLNNRMYYSKYGLLSLSLALAFVFFFINEYKINSMRWPQYFMTVWLWFGIANSLINTYKQERIEYNK